MVESTPADGSADGAPERARVPVIIACSSTDLEAADAAAGGLRDRGFQVAVFGGAEDGSSRLSEVVERFERQGLYVLCRGGELDRDGIDRLRALLREHEVPFGRTLTLSTAQGGARALEERIVSVARRMVTGRYEKTAAPIAADPGDSTEAAEGGEPGESHVGVDLGDVDQWADSLAGGQRPAIEPPAELSEHAPTSVVTPGVPVGTDAQPSDVLGEPTDPGVPEDDYERIDKTMVTRPSGAPLPEASFQPDESSAPTPAADPMPADDVDVSTFRSGPNPKLLIGGGIAAMLLLAIIVAVASGSDEPESTPETAETPAAVEESETPEPEVDAEPEAEPEPAAEDEPEADPADAEPEPAAVAQDEAPEEDPKAEVDEQLAALAAIDTDAAEKSLAHRSVVDPALLDERPLDADAREQNAAIAQALNDRELRSWNVFLLAGDDAPSMAFGDAETFCKTLSVGDVTGWRLPSVGELLSLSGAKMLDRKAVFWSETPGDAFGDTRIVVNAKKGSTSSVKTDWDGARPICVRVRE